MSRTTIRRILQGGPVCVILVALHVSATADDDQGSRLAYLTNVDGVAAETETVLRRRLGNTWQILGWNGETHTPARAIGRPMGPFAGFVQTEGEAESGARAFFESVEDILAIEAGTLAVRKVAQVGERWSVFFQQTYNGLPVRGAVSSVGITSSGMVYMFGVNYHSMSGIDTTPQITALAAEYAALAAAQSVASEALSPRTATLEVLPVRSDGQEAVSYALAYRIPLVGQIGAWNVWVDAHTGTTLRVEDTLERATYSGTVLGDVDSTSYCDGQSPDFPFRNVDVIIDNVGTATTDENGQFAIEGAGGSQAFTAQLRGADFGFVLCDSCDDGEAVITGTIASGVPAELYWDNTNSRDAERDIYYYLNLSEQFILDIDSTFTNEAFEAHAEVIDVGGVANPPYYCGGGFRGADPPQFFFFRTGGNCHDGGTQADVMCHEYGHLVQHVLYGETEQLPDLSEGNADVAAALILNEPGIGEGIFEGDCESLWNCRQPSSGVPTPNCCRTCDNDFQLSELTELNCAGTGHGKGRLVCGVAWDLHKLMAAKYGTVGGRAAAAATWYNALKLVLPIDHEDQVDAYFIANDDDADLSNGTPDYDAICAAAEAHGFTCPERTAGVFIEHTPLSSTDDTEGPYAVVATITSTEDAIDEEEIFVYYRVNGLGNYSSVAMTPTLNEDEYSADIPGQACLASIEYYIVGEDLLGNEGREPVSAPFAVHDFFVGTSIYSQAFESSSDWLEDETHSATAGGFARIDPIQTEWQPERDGTPAPAPGVYAWVTGQNTDRNVGVNDVDGGIAGTHSPVIDVTGYSDVVLSLKYFHGQRDHGDDMEDDDYFRVDLSDDGGETYVYTWVEIEDERTSPVWTTVEMVLDTLSGFSLTDSLMIRVQASDGPSEGDIVEAGIDEVLLLGCAEESAPEVAVVSPNGGELFQAGQTTPIRWNAPGQPQSLVSLYLSTDGGLTYGTTIATAEPNDGLFEWTVPAMGSTSAKIMVVLAGVSGASDASDESFLITDAQTGVDSRNAATFFLAPGEPDPSSGVTALRFGLAHTGDMRLCVYSVQGRLMRTLRHEMLSAGSYRAVWDGTTDDGRPVPSGHYFARLVSSQGEAVQRLTIVR